MKLKYCWLYGILFFSLQLSGQGLFEFFKLTADDDGPEKFDRISVDFNFNNWRNTPSGIKQGMYSFGLSAYWFKDLPLGKKSNLAFAFGLGFDSHNVHNNGYFIDEVNADGVSFTDFRPYSGGFKYFKNKASFNYLEAPVEFRIRTMNKNAEDRMKFNFRLYVGFKGGVLLNNHIKYRDAHIKIKEFNIPNTLIYRYGPTLKIGFNKIAFHAFYSLTSVFVKNKGIELIPYSLGISWMRF